MIGFEIRQEALDSISEELGATKWQARYAMTVAIRRTQSALKKLATKGLLNELHLRSLIFLKKRIKSVRLKKRGTHDEASLWFGLNPLQVSAFKGRIREETKGVSLNDFYFEGAFAQKSRFSQRITVLKRQGKTRLPLREETIDVHKDSFKYLEEQIFSQVEQMFFKFFTRDLKARVKFQIGGK